ncbi:MAG TPA: homoserine O-succinyltransferase [Xanthobacteraceae bacterium]
MPILLDTARSGATAELRGENCLTIGLVNNMPDAALDATERQFIDLVRAASPGLIVRFKLFSLAAIPRSAQARAALAVRYRDVSELWDAHIDGLIVTGNEPRAPSLRDEPYWPALTRLMDWAEHNTDSTIWSCLAAHAAVLHADGIERRPRKEKLFGVFPCDIVRGHSLTAGMPPRLPVPHSRHNDLPAGALIANGYRVLSTSVATGADMFVGPDRGASQFLFFQGHPEYDADSLAREFRRDVGRFLRGEREGFPPLPQGYFDKEASGLIEEFCMRARTERAEKLLRQFPMKAIEGGLQNTWQAPAIGIYQNWIAYLQERKAKRRVPAWPIQRTRRERAAQAPAPLASLVDKPVAVP